VLIVDDDRESCDMMLEALGDYGASLHAALSAGAAIDSSPRPSHVRSPHLSPCATGDEQLGHVR